MTGRMKTALAFTSIGTLLLVAFMIMALSNGNFIIDHTAVWIVTGSIGAWFFCLGTALL